MKKASNKVGWIFSVIFILAGLSGLALGDSIPFAICCILFGISLMPLLRKTLNKKGLFQRRILSIGIPVLLFVACIITVPSADTKSVQSVSIGSTKALTQESIPTATPTPTDTPTPEPTPAYDSMEIHFLDVGQGDSILIKTPSAAMLVDAGKNEDGATIVSYLQQQGVTKLDYVIGTHPHEDHIGGLDDVINSFDIGTVILPGKTHTSQTYMDVLTSIQNKGLEVTQAVTGNGYSLGTAVFTVLSPNSDADYGDNLNDWSIGIKLVNGNNSVVLTGDAEARTENDILATGIDLKADILKAGHHGSETSNIESFVNTISPKYAVISCGKDNQYGHPDVSVLQSFQNKGIETFRTDEQGAIVATSDGANITWSTTPSTSMTPGIKPEEVPAAQNAPQPVESIPDSTPEATEAPQAPEQGEMVWISATGDKYHNKPDCGRMNPDKARQMTRDDAEANSYEPCSKCF